MSRKTMASSTRSAIGIAVMAVMSIGIIAFSNPLYHALKGPITTSQPEIPLADGTYIHEAPEPDSNGFRDSTRITVCDDGKRSHLESPGRCSRQIRHRAPEGQRTCQPGRLCHRYRFFGKHQCLSLYQRSGGVPETGS